MLSTTTADSRRPTALAAACAYVCVVLAALAPNAAAASPTIDASWRIVGARPAVEGTTPGAAETDVALDVRVSDGWHVNAHDPDRSYLIPTELAVETPAGAEVVAIDYPDPVLRTLRFAPEAPLRVYEGRFTIGVRMRGAGSGPLTGRLRYQACSDDTCLPPRTVPVTLTLGSSATAAAATSAASPTGATSRFDEWMRHRGLVATLMLAALFGLGLNLTPCVYPLISVTIAYFGGQSGDAGARVLILAAAYVLGIAVTFSTLGVVAALSGGIFGAALQQPLVLGAIAAVLVLLAASNFGLYQLRAPTLLTSRAGKASAGVVGALAMGLTMGVVAAPCVGPIVIALLLFVAARQDALLGFGLFFALAIGMGAPYVGLAVAAGSIRRLPRSGEWLTWIEHLFGFVLLGMALYFAAPLLGARAVAVLTPLLIAIAGVFLGFIDPAGSRLAGFAAARRALGVAAVLIAIWTAVPQRVESAIAWQPFSHDALASARDRGRPVLVDFTAAWCLPCRENDTITFRDPAVAREAERFVMLRADVTETTPQNEEWMQRYRILGVPTIVVVGAAGAEVGRVVGFVEPSRLLALMGERG